MNPQKLQNNYSRWLAVGGRLSVPSLRRVLRINPNLYPYYSGKRSDSVGVSFGVWLSVVGMLAFLWWWSIPLRVSPVTASPTPDVFALLVPSTRTPSFMKVASVAVVSPSPVPLLVPSLTPSLTPSPTPSPTPSLTPSPTFSPCDLLFKPVNESLVSVILGVDDLRLLDVPRSGSDSPKILYLASYGSQFVVIGQGVCGSWDGQAVWYVPVYSLQFGVYGWIGTGRGIRQYIDYVR